MYPDSVKSSISPTLKSHLEAQRNFATELSRKIFDTAQQMSALHLRLTQELLQQWSSASQQLLCARDTGEFMSLAAAQCMAGGDTLLQYQQQLGKLMTQTNNEISRAAETHMPAASRTGVAIGDDVIRKTAEETAKAAQRQRELIEKMHPGGLRDGAGHDHDHDGSAQADQPY